MIKNRIRSFILALIAFSLIIGTYSTLNKQQLNSLEQTNRLAALKELVAISDKIEMSLNLDLQFATFIGLLVTNNPDIPEDYIAEISKPILHKNRSIKNVALAPDGIISFIYPLKGNEEALGHNLLADEGRESFVTKAIKTRASTTQGPIKAIQGGNMVINREPIFTTINGVESFWGFSAVSVDFDLLIEESGLELSKDGYLFALQAKETNGIDDFNWGHTEIFQRDSIINTIELPNQKWDIAIFPEGGWTLDNNFFQPISLLFYTLAILGFLATYLISNQYSDRALFSTQDFLTGTLNKRTFLNSFKKKTKDKNKNYGLIILDINDFKIVNDRLGHPVGDKVLIEIAHRIKAILGKNDMLSRFGGDEYIIFLDDIVHSRMVQNMITAICEEVSRPMIIDNHTLHITIAAGGATFPQDGTEFKELYRLADHRMYDHKKTKCPL